MRLMTTQAILELHFRSMWFMAVKTGLVLALIQTMTVMTVGAVLFAMCARLLRQLAVDVLMAGPAGRAAVFNPGKIRNQRGVRCMAAAAVLQAEMRVVPTVMTGGTFREDGLAFRRMGHMAVQAANIVFMGGFLADNGPGLLKMTLETVLIRQGHPLDFSQGN